MRLLHVYAGPFPSHQGTQVYLRGVLTALAARGHEVVLRCWHAGQGEDPPGVEVRRLRPISGGDVLTSGPHPTRAPHAALMLAALRRDLREPWDVVHAHHLEATLLAAGLGARPLLHHAHTSLAEELPTYRGGTLAGFVGAVLDRSLAASCHAAIALSERGADTLRAHGVEQVLAVPPGVDVAELSGDQGSFRRQHGLGDADWVIYTGNLDAYQDLPVLLDAVQLGGHRLLVVTGSTTDALRRELEARRVPPERFRLVQSTDFADTRDAMAAAAVGVVPRACCAGFPMKVLNLLGAGVPTVVVRGAVALIAGTVPAPAGDAAAMSAAIDALLADPTERVCLGAAARTAIARDYSWDAHAAAVEREAVALRARVTPRGPRS